jgi:hypothetical protein
VGLDSRQIRPTCDGHFSCSDGVTWVTLGGADSRVEAARGDPCVVTGSAVIQCGEVADLLHGQNPCEKRPRRRRLSGGT